MGTRAILTVIALGLAAGCAKNHDETGIADGEFAIYEQPVTAVNPNLPQLRHAMRAFTAESTRLDHATLALTLDALASALHGVPYAYVSAEAKEVHRVAEVMRTMGPGAVQRSEAVREALEAAVAALNKASVEPRYSVQRPLIADLAREVDALDPRLPVAKQAFLVKLAICDTANAIAVMPASATTTLPCTQLPAASVARELSSLPRTEN